MPEPTQEKWIYLGAYLTSSKKLLNNWLMGLNPDADPQGLWTGGHSYIVGGIYDVQVLREGDKTSRVGNPIWTGDIHDDDSLVSEWIVRDRGNKLRYKRIRAEKKADDSLEQALRPITQYAQKCRTAADRQALIAEVIDHIYKNSGGWS